MDGSGHERFGLTNNPFQDISSEAQREFVVYHVSQDADHVLAAFREETYRKQRSSTLVLTGPMGAGKTQRVRLALEEARSRGAYAAMFTATSLSAATTEGLVDSMMAAANLGSFARTLNRPKWFRDLQSLRRKARRNADPEDLGRRLAGILNDRAPAFLLLNDVHHLTDETQVEPFFRTLQAIASHAEPGVMVLISSYPEYWTAAKAKYPALTARVSRTFDLSPFRFEEAALLLAKRIIGQRTIEELDPLYPFNEEAVKEMHTATAGNPRRLLKLADRVLEQAVRQKGYRITAETVHDVLRATAALEDPSMAARSGGPNGAATVLVPDVGQPAGDAVEPPSTVPTPSFSRRLQQSNRLRTAQAGKKVEDAAKEPLGAVTLA